MTDPPEVKTQDEVELPDVVDAAERLPAEIEAADLRKYFSLTIANREQVERCRGPANKLGFVMWTFGPAGRSKSSAGV